MVNVVVVVWLVVSVGALVSLWRRGPWHLPSLLVLLACSALIASAMVAAGSPVGAVLVGYSMGVFTAAVVRAAGVDE